MNFFKKMLGFGKGLEEKIKEFKAKGTLFEVVKQTRNLKLVDCTISIGKEMQNYVLNFEGDKKQSYQLPIHLNMNPVVFVINRNGKQYSCFEWQLEVETEHVGCFVDPDKKSQLKEILCHLLHNMANDQHIKDPLVFCKQLGGVPVYKSAEKSVNSNVSSGVVSEERVTINDVLIKQAQKDENKMVHTCSLYHVKSRERKLVQEYAVFVLKSFPDYKYEFHLVNATGYTFVKKYVDAGLNYQINLEHGYVRWIDTDQDCLIVEVNLDGKRDAALSLKYNMLEVMYELRQHRKFDQIASPEEIAYLNKIDDGKCVEEKTAKKVVQIYKDKDQIENVEGKQFLYKDEELKQGGLYANLCQAKIRDFSIAALGSLMETLSITEDNHIKIRDKRRLFDKNSREVEIADILLHDQDTKSFIQGQDGKLYYHDIEKGKIIEEFAPSPKKGIVMICPEFKLAETANFNTFKAISENSIYEIDPRISEGVGSMKDYSGNPRFTTISPTGDGRFATGSNNGEIRFFKQIGKNANNKFTSTGQSVRHLDTTKNGQWVLATFQNYIRLIPTQNDHEQSLYNKKMPLDSRPHPIRLQISLDDVQQYGIKQFQFLPAKFDESKEGLEKYIISGFGEYTVIWNLGRVVRGDKKYLISKAEGKVLQADFYFNNPSKIIMTTEQGIVLKENRIKR